MNAREFILDLLRRHYERYEGEFSDDATDLASEKLNEYRDEIRHEAAQEIRNKGFEGPCCCGEGPDDAADLIDPEMAP
jgi:hypothetical protein